jgi:hypothetical protein
MSYDYDDPAGGDEEGSELGRRLNRARRDGFDLTSLGGLGVRVILVMFLLGLALILVFLVFRQPLSTRTPAPEPTVLLTEGSPVLPTFTPGPTATPLATETPIVTAGAVLTESATVPAEPTGPIAVGATAEIANTESQGANLRGAASTSAEIVQLLGEGTRLTVLEGPTSADGFEWWRVQVADSETAGWVAAPFLRVMAP